MPRTPEPDVVIPPAAILLDDGDNFEIIDGERVQLPPSSVYASVVASRLLTEVGAFVARTSLGRVLGNARFLLRAPTQRSRRCEFAFVSYQRWPKSRPVPADENAWDVVPDWAAEVVSPTDLAEDLLAKVEEYFRAGVWLVWVVYPRRQIIHIFESLSVIRVLTAADELTGGTVLPEFRLPVKSLFED